MSIWVTTSASSMDSQPIKMLTVSRQNMEQTHRMAIKHPNLKLYWLKGQVLWVFSHLSCFNHISNHPSIYTTYLLEGSGGWRWVDGDNISWHQFKWKSVHLPAWFDSLQMMYNLMTQVWKLRSQINTGEVHLWCEHKLDQPQHCVLTDI